MKKTKKDIQQDFLMFLLKPLVRVWMFFDMKAKYHFDASFNPKRKEPYILLGNHTFMYDIIHIPLNLRKQPFIIASQTLFMKRGLKFLLTQIAHAIPKSKGAADVRAVRGLLGAVKRGYAVMIMPEGNTTFNGETTYIEESTMKLIKKLNVDVVGVLNKGGYLSKPRWATGKRKNRKVEFFYKVIITKEELKERTLKEINDIVNKELYNNDYEYQKEVMIPHPGKQLAEGLENVLYSCPNCESTNSLKTNGNDIVCSECETHGHVDEYGFIHGFKYDNVLEWDNWQRNNIDKLLSSRLESEADLFYIDDLGLSRKLIGRVRMVCENKVLSLTGAVTIDIPIYEMFNPIVTLRKNFQFQYGDKFYFFRVDQFVASFLRIAQRKY